MSGHGWVTPNPNGTRARCGGPAICRECQREAGRLPCADRHGQEDQGNEDSVQVTVHGKYGRGPMPVEFRDALVEMVRLVKQGIDNGTIGRAGAQKERANDASSL